MPLEIGATLSGRIIRITSDGIQVVLPEGKIGWIPIDQCSSSAGIHARFQVEESVAVKIVSRTADEQFQLTLVPGQGEEPSDAFDQEFHRLSHMLTNSASKKPMRTATQHERPVEEAIKKWIKQTEESLPRFQKHRSERLRAVLYGREKDGGGDGKRNDSNR
jgi:predicted RNA-binding protein with RPS1 domain